MTKTIEWHEARLKALQATIQEKEREWRAIANDAARLNAEAFFRLHQINTAKKRGITSFDGEKFHKKMRHFWEGK